MRTSPIPNRRRALALGLVLPLAAAGAASAEPGGWVDPPARSGAVKPGPAAAAASPAPKEATTETAKTLARGGAERPAPRHARTEAGREARAAEAPPETVHRHARPGRRLADTPAAGPGPAGAHAEAARALASAYLATVSGSGAAMVGAAARFYGAQVRFYGRPTTMAGLIAEKRGFAARWPERRYEARAVRTACAPDGATCTVRAIVDFRAASPARGAVSRGSSELVLEVSFAGGRPVIVAESGRVLRRGAQEAQALVPAGGRA